MTGFTYVTTLAAGPVEFNVGIGGLALGSFGGETRLYTAAGPDGGLMSYRVGAGVAASHDGVQLYAAGSLASAPVGLVIADLDGGMIVPLGPSATVLTGYDLTTSGGMTGTHDALLPATAAAPVAFCTIEIGDQSFAFASVMGSDQVRHYRVLPDGTLEDQTAGAAASTYQGVSLPDLATIAVAGQAMLLTVDSVANRLRCDRIEPDGTLTPLGGIGAAEGLGMSGAIAVATAHVAGHAYAIVGAANSSSLSVIEVLQDGTLIPVDHILDDLDSRFQGLQSLQVVEINARSFLVTGGGDDGLTLFEILPGGQLLGLATIEDSDSRALADVTRIVATAIGGELQVFAASASEPGVAHLRVDLSNLAAPKIGGAGADALVGGAARDLLIGGAGNDTLSGGAGDDVLVDGSGRDRLSGGSGADTFVLIADGEEDTIEDFQPGIDRLDLSQFTMFYGIDQLAVTSTASGAVLRYRDEVITIISAAGTSLSAYHFGLTGVVSVNRPPLVTLEAGLLLSGGAGNDQHVGGAGDDTIMGSPGTDAFMGGAGFDTADYSAASGRVALSLATGLGNAGDALGDSFSAIEAVVGSPFGDWLEGDAQANRLSGNAGADVVNGGAGDDTIEGGTGDDHLWGENGADSLSGGAGIDFLSGGADGDWLNGNDGADTIFGCDGADTISAGLHNDNAFGGRGDDVIDGGAGNDRLTGGRDNDSLSGGEGDDLLIGHIGNDTILGGPGNDTISGGLYADTLIGGDGDDRIIGHGGTDLIDGGPGRDVLFGGAGNDSFVFRDGGGMDRVQDFDPGSDLLLLDAALWGGGGTVTQILDLYAHEANGNVSLAFGDGDIITLAGVVDAGELLGSILIF